MNLIDTDAGVFKFFASDTWKNMKPNIAKNIGEALVGAGKLLDGFVNLMKEKVLPYLEMLASMLFTVIKFVGDFIPGVEVGTNIKGKLMRQAKADIRNKDMSDEEIEAQVDEKIRKIRFNHLKTTAQRLEFKRQNQNH